MPHDRAGSSLPAALYAAGRGEFESTPHVIDRARAGDKEAIDLGAQTFPCGVAIETSRPPADHYESHFAVRLGPHLFSEGTARLSMSLSP
jgi:hypothetical protein